MSKLDEYLLKPVADLVADSPREMSDAEKERHRIYALLLMSIVAYNWNSNKRNIPSNVKPNPDKDYGNNPLLSTDANIVKRGKFLKNDYLGHNIAAFAVDKDGYIMDFDFNHNEIFNSSVEHAEARLLKRLFSLDQISDSWNMDNKSQVENTNSNTYSQLLQGVTLYTSLESCAQCSGIMTLGNVNEVFYMQIDDGQYKIGNILYRLTDNGGFNRKALAPRPVPVGNVNFTYYDKLNDAFKEYAKSQEKPSVTSFLCTEQAFLIFLEAEQEFSLLKIEDLNYPNAKIKGADGIESALSNAQALDECKSFYKYVAEKGRRGTPH
jgi:tRNA(Arg) A34 adenosine deaminase TadA